MPTSYGQHKSPKQPQEKDLEIDLLEQSLGAVTDENRELKRQIKARNQTIEKLLAAIRNNSLADLNASIKLSERFIKEVNE